MFDIAFSELVVIGVVALIVIGPEKLPKVARTVGLLLGRVQRYVNGVKSDISRELRFEELQRLQQEVQQGIRQAENTIHQTGHDLEREMQQLGDVAQVHELPDSQPAVTTQSAAQTVSASQAESVSQPVSQAAPQSVPQQSSLDLSVADPVAGAAEHDSEPVATAAAQFQHDQQLQDDHIAGTQPASPIPPKQDKPD